MKLLREKPITLAIADDHVLFRSGIVNLLPKSKIIVVAEADNGAELIKAINDLDEAPEICILDISMPVMDGYQTLLQLKKHWPEMKVLMVSMYNNDFTIINLIANGASGYILKDCNPEELVRAIEYIHERGYYHSDIVSRTIYSPHYNILVNLKINEKELAFMRYCCSDLHYNEIAKKMYISSRTIESYRENLFLKLGVKSRQGLVLFALQTGLVSLKKEKEKQ